MKSIHSILVILIGWLLFGAYFYYDYSFHGDNTLNHFFSFHSPAASFLNIVILCTLVGSHITAYLINDRKKLLLKTSLSQSQLAQATQEWKSTFDSIPYGVIITDKNCNIIRSNKYLAGRTALLSDEPSKNNKCYEVVCGKDNPYHRCPINNSVNSKKTETHEFIDSFSGKRISESITPIKDDNSEITSYVHVLIDITDAREKETKLTESKDAFFNMLKDLDTAFKDLKSIHEDLIIALSNIIDAKSPWTCGHSIETTNYAIAIAREMEMEHHEVETLRVAALLHDIGKIGTFDKILDKPGELNAQEAELIRLHPLKGEEMLNPINGLEHLLPIIRAHHEKYDGSGYPDGLKGDDIPMLARVLCVADAFDAMVSDRPYRTSKGKEYALSELQRCSATHFDPTVVSAFSQLLTKSSSIDSGLIPILNRHN